MMLLIYSRGSGCTGCVCAILLVQLIANEDGRRGFDIVTNCLAAATMHDVRQIEHCQCLL